MESRPKIKLQLSGGDKITETTGLVLWFILLISSCIIYFNLPDTIPVHFNGSGVPNDFGNKTTLLLLPVIGTIIFWGLTALNKYPEIFNYPSAINSENAEKYYTNATRMLRFLKLAIVIIFTLIVLLTYFTATGKIRGLGSWFLPFVLSTTLLPALYFIIKGFRKNN